MHTCNLYCECGSWEGVGRHEAENAPAPVTEEEYDDDGYTGYDDRNTYDRWYA